MKRSLALLSLVGLFAAGTLNAEPAAGPNRASSKFKLFGAELSATLTELPTLGGCCSMGMAVNSNGEVVGFSQTLSSQLHAFFWSPASPGSMIDLDPFGGQEVRAFDINDDGTVVGWKTNAFGEMRAFKWKAGVGMSELKLVGGNQSIAFGINNAGRIVGASTSASGPLQAVIWNPDGTITQLGTLASGAGVSIGRAINEYGQVVGMSWTSSSELHGFLWTPGSGMTDVGKLFDNFSDAWGLNGDGWAVGESGMLSGGSRHAFLSSSGSSMLDLEPVDGQSSIAHGINSLAWVVGYSFASGPQRAILWGPADLRKDLGTLGGSETDLGAARGISEHGLVAGYSWNGSTIVATVWTLSEVAPPPPPPSDPCVTPEEKVECLIAQIDALYDANMLNKGRARSLRAKAEAAQRQMRRQNTRAAANILRALSNEVHAFLHAEILGPAEGPELIERARSVLP